MTAGTVAYERLSPRLRQHAGPAPIAGDAHWLAAAISRSRDALRTGVLRAKGASWTAIADALNRAGVATAQGGRQWWPATVRKVAQTAGGADADSPPAGSLPATWRG